MPLSDKPKVLTLSTAGVRPASVFYIAVDNNRHFPQLNVQ